MQERSTAIYAAANHIRLDACNSARREAFMRRRHRIIEIDAAAGILDDDDPEPLACGVLRRITYAEIEGEAGEEYARETALAQVAGNTCRSRMIVFIERRVRIDCLAEALAHHQRRMRDIEGKMEIGARRFLDAMIRPQHLRSVGQSNRLERRAARVR